MNIAICDDSKDMRDAMEDIIRNNFGKAISKGDVSLYIFEYGDDICASPIVFDIVLLDIIMHKRGLDGIATGRILKSKNKYVKIIIVTSYMRYIDDAMSFKVFRYHEKKQPFDSEGLKKQLLDAVKEYYHDIRYVEIEEDGSYSLLNLHEIIKLETYKRRIIISHTEGKIITGKSFSYWKEQVVAPFIFESYRGILINLEYVVKYDKTLITLKNGSTDYTAYLSRSNYQAFRERMKTFLATR